MFKLILIFFIFITISCSQDDDVSNNLNENLYNDNTSNDKELFEKANEFLKDEEYELALIELDKLEVLFPNSDFNKKGLLTSAYIYFLKEEYEKSRAISENYKKYYPGSNDMVYANYLEAMTYFIMIKKTNFSQQNAIIAREKFNFILNAYPNSNYEIDIITKIQLIENILANHKLVTAKFYLDKKNREASLIYLKEIYDKHKDSIHIAETLYLITESYFVINEKELARKYAAILAYNFPDSIWYDKAYKLLNELEINEVEDKWYEKFNPIKILVRERENNNENDKKTLIQAIE